MRNSLIHFKKDYRVFGGEGGKVNVATNIKIVADSRIPYLRPSAASGLFDHVPYNFLARTSSLQNPWSFF